MMNVQEIVTQQRLYFNKKNTLAFEFRKSQLLKLRKNILKYENDLKEALYKDLNKNETESYFAEIGQVLNEITFLLKNLKKLMKNKRVKSHFFDFPSKSYTSPHPYGVALIISPWNYPVMLTLGPLVGAIASGNTAIIKPSEFSQHTTDVLEKLIQETFDPEYVVLVKGAIKETQDLLNQKFDFIFFTGSSSVGKIVMEKASKHLTPIVLELGGKSPVIVDKTANIKVSAKRIAFGKHLNAGQTCIAPDHLYVHKDIKDEFISHLKQSIEDLYGQNPITSKDYGKIIKEKHYKRLLSLIDKETIVYGGNKDDALRKIAPTIVDNITHDHAIMQEEIFGPILPIIPYDNLDEVISLINSNPSPLALYIFSENKQVQDRIIQECTFGGGCINDTMVHVSSDYLPFGGVGKSGMGSYHGKASFQTFSHYRSILHKSTKVDVKARYAPYNEQKEKLTKMVLK